MVLTKGSLRPEPPDMAPPDDKRPDTQKAAERAVDPPREER